MTFTQPVTDIIKQRISVRTYTQRPIAPQQETQLKTLLAAPPNAPLRSRLRFDIITAKPGDTETLKGLGTYGTIKNPAGFIVGIMEHSDQANVEDFGYVMEQIILFATDLKLGTCWLGGSFKKSKFAEAIAVKAEETVPAVTSIGHIPEKLALKDRFIRASVGAAKRLPWERLFFANNFTTPLTQAQAGVYAQPLEMVRLGPSASNKQPWRIVHALDRPAFHFYVQRNKSYSRQLHWMKLADLQRMDIGIAMCHFELTAREQGLQGTWQIADPGLRPLPEQTEYIVSWQGSAI